MKSILSAVIAALVFRILSPKISRLSAEKKYDFIVVGGGTSGSVVASRLSDNPTAKILLLEAGNSDVIDLRILVPAYQFNLASTPIDWNYTLVAQQNALANNPNRTSAYPQGKVLGGTSCINYLQYVRGSPHDYDSWEDHGALGWDFKSVEHNFRNVENAKGEGMPTTLGRNGMLKLTRLYSSSSTVARLMTQLTRSLGMKMGNYIDQIEDMGFSIRSVYRGLRQNAAHLIFDHFFQRAYASKEVIVSAGAFGTPHLLMLSGIGPRKELENFGISVLVDSPGVGSNLQDHPSVLHTFQTDAKLAETENLSVSVYITLGHPKSTGKVSLQSSDPTVLPLVDPNYYSNPDDLDLHIEGHRLLERFENSEGFVGVGAKYIETACQEFFTPTTPRSSEFYECMIRHSNAHMSHACCTAKMGSSKDRTSVVDHELRVHGIQNLRIADASVMPHLTSANTQAPCYMIGEKAAEMIKKTWNMN